MPPTPCALGADPRLVGDPVDTGTGAAVDQTLDFRLTGPLELWWVRHYDSSVSHRRFALGWGHTHDFDRTLRSDVDGFRYTAPLGRTVGFPPLRRDGDQAASEGHRLRRASLHRYEVHHHGEPAMEFEFHDFNRPARLRRLFRGADEIRLHYGADGRWESIVDSAGRVVWVAEGPEGRIDGLTLRGADGGPHTALVAYRYDDRGNLIATRDATGHGFACVYDAANRLVRRIGRKGFSFHFAYDPSGRCVRSAGDGGMLEVGLDYDPSGRLTRVTRADGGVWTYVFDDIGRLERVVDALGGVRTYVRDGTGRVASEVDPGGGVTTLVYDAAGAPVARLEPFGRRVALPEDPNAPLPRAHRVAANPAEYEYGRLLDLTGVSLPSPDAAAALPIAYEARRLVVTRAADPPATTAFPPRPLGPTWWPKPARGRVFNDLGKLVRQDDEHGRSRHWSYDASGNVDAYVDFDGSRWRYDCGAWHLRLAEADPNGGRVEFVYNAAEAVAACTDAGGTRTEYAYDANDHLTEVRRHGRVRDRYRRDAAGNLLAKYAGDGRPLLEVEGGPGGLPVRRTLASGDEHTFRYDAAGRCVVAATPKDVVELAYDALGNRVAEARNGAAVETRYAGWRAPAERVFLGRFAVAYERRDDGTLAITDPSRRTHLIRLLPHGIVERQLGRGGAEVAQYDLQGRCLLKLSRHASGRLWARQFEWSGEGELRRVRDSRDGDVLHEYDAAHRLRWRRTADGRVERYDLDEADNLVRQPGLDGVVLAPGNRLRTANGSTFTYDDRDHVAVRETPDGVVRYAYDSRDQLVRVETPRGTFEADYDAFGRRTRTRWGGRATEYHWSDDQLLAEVDPEGRLRLYVYADPLALTPLAFLDYDSVDAAPPSGRRYLVFADQVGAPCAVEDDAGEEVWRARVDPYGRARVGAGARIAFGLRLPGHYLDAETGLHYNRFRYYDPVLGRYLQSDPWGLAGGYNVYAYRTNPLLHVDVRGLGEENVPPKGAPKDDEESPPNPSRPTGDDDDPGPQRPPPVSDEEMWKAVFEATKGNGRKVTEAAIDPATGRPVVRPSESGPVDPVIQPYVRPDRPPEVADADGGNQQGRCGMPRAVGDIADANGGELPPGGPVRVTQGGLRYYPKDKHDENGNLVRPKGYYYEPPCVHCVGIHDGRPHGSDPAQPPLPPIVEYSDLPPGVPGGLAPGEQVPFTPPPGWEE